MEFSENIGQEIMMIFFSDKSFNDSTGIYRATYSDDVFLGSFNSRILVLLGNSELIEFGDAIENEL